LDARRVRKVVAGIGLIDEEQLSDDESLLEQGAVDSTGLVDLQLWLEEELGREIRAEELNSETLLRITSIVDWFNNRPDVAGLG
jgi:acyl carrier protein